MHRQVRRVGDEGAGCIEHGAGEIEPLLDVHRLRGVAQGFAHLLGDGHEQVVEHLEQHRVGGGAEPLALARRGARQDDVVVLGQRQLPAGLDDDGLVRLDDQCRAGEVRAGRERFAHDDGRLVPSAARIKPRRCGVRPGGSDTLEFGGV